MDPKHISNDLDSFDDGENNAILDDEKVIDLSEMNEGVIFIGKLRCSLEKTRACSGDTMQMITKKCKQGGIIICDHATTFMRVLASNIQNIHLT